MANIYIRTIAEQKQDEKRTWDRSECNVMCKNCLAHCKGCNDPKYVGCADNITIDGFKTLIKKFRELEAESDKLDSEWVKHPEDEEIEKAWNEAYRAEMIIYGLIIENLKGITGVDTKTARRLFNKYQDRIEDLLNRCI